MKKMKRFLGLFLAGVLTAATLVGCSGGSGNGETKTAGGDTTAESKTDTQAQTDGSLPSAESTGFKAENTYKIGYNYFGSGSYALLTLANNSKLVIDAFGNEAMAMDDEFNVEKIVQDIENMISSGVDGLIIWLPAESLYLTVADMCKEAKIPFVLNDKIPSDPEIIKALHENEYFAGAIAPANAVYGEMLANYALDQGWTKCFISGPSAGDPSDTPRIEAFREVFEGAGGTVYTETHADSADAALPQIENALTAYPDIDFVYGSGSDYGIAACQALENMGVDAKVLTSGLDSQALELLQDGTYMQVVNGDYWVCGMYAAVILQNYLDGTPLKDADGKAVWVDDVQPFEVPADKFELYKEHFLDNYCYSTEEIQQMSGKYNPDFNYDAFIKAVHSYSLDERLKAAGVQ